MEDLLATLLSFPAHPPPPQPLSDKQYDESIRLQVDNIRKISHKRLLESTTDGESILDVGSSFPTGIGN
jgi:COP9 signalosome complex subunit 3